MISEFRNAVSLLAVERRRQRMAILRRFYLRSVILGALAVILCFWRYNNAADIINDFRRYSSTSMTDVTSSSSSSSSSSASSRISPLLVLNNNTFDDVKRQQIEHYRKGQALMINVHPTHHGGTSFCQIIGRHGDGIGSRRQSSLAPAFACLADKDNVMPNGTYGIYGISKDSNGPNYPWTRNETEQNIAAIRPYFHMVSWEFNGNNINNNVHKKKSNSNNKHTTLLLLEDTHWEHPKLLSVVITRHPISRLLANDDLTERFHPGKNNGTLTHSGWWNYVTDETIPDTDNFFLRILGGETWKKRK